MFSKLEKVLDERLTFGPRSMPNKGVCRMRVWLGGRGVTTTGATAIVVVSTIEANQGLSIQNGIEFIARKISEMLDILPSRIILFEHWPNHGHYNQYTERWTYPESIDLVTFEWHENQDPGRPSWMRVDPEWVEQLVGEDL